MPITPETGSLFHADLQMLTVMQAISSRRLSAPTALVHSAR